MWDAKRIMVSTEELVAAAAAALEAEDICVPRGAVVGGEVDRGGVRCHHCIGLVRRLGGDTVILFHMTARTKGSA